MIQSMIWFQNILDTAILIEESAHEGFGEDNYCLLQGNSSVVAAVFDGCGGLGARTYEAFQGHTGAYLASRLLSGSIKDWFEIRGDVPVSTPEKLVSEIKAYFQNRYAVLTSYETGGLRMKGSMVRDFPSTAAIALVQYTQSGLLLHVVWAGDSRVYLWDQQGLAQLTEDDIEGEDAYSNLKNDGTLTNVVSSDGRYELHYRCVPIDHPMMIFSATDGCFGYLESPMHFEFTIVDAIEKAQTPYEFMHFLRQEFAKVAGDDFTMAMVSFGFGDFSNLRGKADIRHKELCDLYMARLCGEHTQELTEDMWEHYRKEYERYLV